jgi:histone H3/H4
MPIKARSTAFSSSRMLPCHLYAASAFSASAVSCFSGAFCARAVFAAKCLASGANILAPFAKRRQIDFDDVQTVKQIFAKTIFGGFPFRDFCSSRR